MKKVTQSKVVGGELAQYPELSECVEHTLAIVAFDPSETGGVAMQFDVNPTILIGVPCAPSSGFAAAICGCRAFG